MNNDLKIVGEVIYFQGYRVADLLSSASVPATVMETFRDYIYDFGCNEDDSYDVAFEDGYYDGFKDGKDEGYDDGYSEGYRDGKVETLARITPATPPEDSVSVSANFPED